MRCWVGRMGGMMGIRETFCETCKGTDCLEARLEHLSACPDVIESVIVCLNCGARTHAAYTNDAHEAQIEVMRRLPVGAERTRAQDLYRAAFTAFQAEMREKLGEA